MYTEKFELLEAKIRETARLVARLREEKWQLEQENAQLREHIQGLEEDLQRFQGHHGGESEPDLDHLLQELDTLQHGDKLPPTEVDMLPRRESPAPEGRADVLQRATLYEQKGQFDQAIDAYQRALEVDPDNLEVMQRLAFLLEKLNRDAEASPLWDTIWAMRDPASPTKRRRLR